jgi:hypothetical protein
MLNFVVINSWQLFITHTRKTSSNARRTTTNMKINLKTVANKTFTVDAESSDSIAQVKTKIEQQGEYTASGMKIIFGGKILDDNVTVAEAGINETHKNIVVVAKKVCILHH